METGITETQIYHSQKETGFIRKSINIRRFLLERNDIYNNWDILKPLEESGEIGKKEADKFYSYYKQPRQEFKGNSIITIRYNPQIATVEYWCDNNKVIFINEIYDIPPYFSKFFIKINNCSIIFLSIINVRQ
jgi:hypothetical protein